MVIFIFHRQLFSIHSCYRTCDDAKKHFSKRVMRCWSSGTRIHITRRALKNAGINNYMKTTYHLAALIFAKYFILQTRQLLPCFVFKYFHNAVCVLFPSNIISRDITFTHANVHRVNNGTTTPYSPFHLFRRRHRRIRVVSSSEMHSRPGS